MSGESPQGADRRETDRAWQAYRRTRRQARRAMRWDLLIAAGNKLIAWDLLHDPTLRRDIPGGCSGLGFFVPVQRGGVSLLPGGRPQVLPLKTTLIPLADDDLVPADGRLTFTLPGGPWIVASVRKTAGTGWRLHARFCERDLRRAALLGFHRLAPDGGTTRRLGRLARESADALLGALLRLLPGQPEGRRMKAAFEDFRLADLSPRLLAQRAFWPTVGMLAVLCPLLAGLLAAALLQVADGAAPPLAFCLLSAAVIAWTGGVVCGTTVSVAASSVGALPLTATLTMLGARLLATAGGAHTLAAKLAATPLRFSVLGGLPTLVPAPAWGVALVDVGIVALSLAMAAARRGTFTKGPRGHRARWLMALLLAFSGPGLVMGLSLILQGTAQQRWPLPVGLALIGGPAFAVCVALQHQRPRRRRALLAGALYAVACLLLPWLISSLPGASTALLLTVLGAHVLLQGTFFSLSYLLGERLGGVWIGALASAVEGAAGYTGFLIASHAILWR